MSIKRKSKTMRQLEAISGTELTLGSLMRSIRQGEDSTQVEFSKLLNVSRQYICDLEQGRRFASPKAAVHYAKVLGYSESQFLRLCLQELVDREGINASIDADVHDKAA